MSNLLTKCNADVFKAILDIKQESPEIGGRLIDILQEYEYWWQMPAGDVMWFAAHLPWKLWNLKISTFPLLFESQPITKMP